MRSLFLVATLSALAWARPETYKETEEFQYSRSSSDEGSKSGYYGAQRGNVAGNYEKAHNMDTLAQHQMSGAINQVQGELGDTSKTRAGSVYTAANSAGVYGSGRHYDFSNLQGRHFGESSTSDSSHSSLSSAYNQHLSNQHSSLSQGTGYGTQLGSTHLGSLHAAEDHGSNFAGSNSHSSGYHSASGYNSQSGYNSHSNYDSSLSGQTGGYGTSDQSRRYIVTPVRLVGRPGTQVAIPVYGQAGYDTQRASSSFDQSSSNRYAAQTAASSFDQNAINSEAEVLNNNQQHIGTVPATNGKHYSSSYNYHKAWEKHSEITDAPVVPTANPLSVNSELYEDAQGASGSDLQQANSYSGNAYNAANRYNSFSQSGSSQSRHRSDYRSQSDANSNAYTQGTYGSQSGLAPLVDSQPKSYQSAYSYHKSWEKQGDPYVIVPGTNGEASQNIVSSNTKTGASSQRYGSRQHYSQGSAVDCDSLCRYRRATRSADYYQQDQEDLGQQAETTWDQNLSQQIQQTQQYLNQQSQSENLEDLGQQTQQSLNSFQQQSQSEKLEDLGQQTYDLGNLGQQSQQSLDNFQQQIQSEKLEDLGQHTYDLGNLGQQSQQSLDSFQQQSQSEVEDLGQQTQGKWQELSQKFESNLEDFGQQTQQSWNNFEQQANQKNLENVVQQTQGQWNKMETDSQRSQQTFDHLDNPGQQTQSKWDSLEGLGQQTQAWNGFGNIEQQTKPQKTEELGQQSHNKLNDLGILEQQVQTQWDNINTINKTRNTDTNTEQQTQTHFEGVDQVKPNREHAGDKTQNPDFNSPDDLAFWGLTNEQKHEHDHYYHQHSYNNYNSYSNLQDHGVSWGQHINNNNAQTTHNNPLQSLWDKLDNMEEQSEHSSNENQQNTEYQSSQHSYRQESTYHHESNWESDHSSKHWNRQETNYSGYQPPIVLNSTIEKPRIDQSPTEPIPENPKDDEDEKPEKPESAEIGRGDIGAEDDSKTTPKTANDFQTYTTQTKHEKSPEELEALSLSRGIEKDTSKLDSLSVLSISQQKWLEEQRLRAVEELHHESGSRSSTTTSTTTPRTVINKNTTPNVHIGSQKYLGEHEEIHVHDKTQQSEGKENNELNFQKDNTMQQNQDFDQQNALLFQNLAQHSQPLDQQNTEQQFEDFGQQTQDLSQQNLQQFYNLGQNGENINQQNTGQQLEDFGQQTQDLSQQNLQQLQHLAQHRQTFEQQNTGQKLEDFGQQTQDLSQQNLQQLQHLAQHRQTFEQQNTGQKLEDFGQQTQDLSQQNLQQIHHLGPHSEKIGQLNTEQQLEDYGQQTQNLNQQNLQFTNLEQHSQNSDQHQAREFQSHSNTELVQEEEITSVRAHGSQTHPKQEIEIVPPVVLTTEKPGFWKSVGSKLTSAKDSVASWFKKS